MSHLGGTWVQSMNCSWGHMIACSACLAWPLKTPARHITAVLFVGLYGHCIVLWCQYYLENSFFFVYSQLYCVVSDVQAVITGDYKQLSWTLKNFNGNYIHTAYMPSIRHCRTCGRLCAGHPGRCGPSCTNTPISMDPKVSNPQPDSNTGQDTGTTDMYMTPSTTIHRAVPNTSGPPPVTSFPTGTGGAAGVSQVQPHTSTTHSITQSATRATTTVTTVAGTAALSATSFIDVSGHLGSTATGANIGASTHVVSASGTRMATSGSHISHMITPAQAVGNFRLPYMSIAHYTPASHNMPLPPPMQGPLRPAQPQQMPPQSYHQPVLSHHMDTSFMAQQIATMQNQLARLETAAGQAQAVGAHSIINSGHYNNSNAQSSVIEPAGHARLVNNSTSEIQYLGQPHVIQPLHSQLGVLRPPLHGHVHGYAQPNIATHAATSSNWDSLQPAPSGYGTSHLLTDHYQPPIPGLVDIDTLPDVTKYSPIIGMPDRIIRSALKGNYANLDDYLSPVMCTLDVNQDLQAQVDVNTGFVTYKCKSLQTKLINFDKWLQAFMNYEHLMVNVHGYFAYQAIAPYKKYIQEADKKFNWETVVAFDIRHRQAISGKHINMLNMDPVMVAWMLDSCAVRDAIKCTKCKSVNHATADCPLNNSAQNLATLPPAGSAGGSTRNRSRSRGKEPVCKNFNKNACTFQGCKRQHVCIVCKGELPVKECLLRGNCAPKDSAASKTQ